MTERKRPDVVARRKRITLYQGNSIASHVDIDPGGDIIIRDIMGRFVTLDRVEQLALVNAIAGTKISLREVEG